ncbi:glycosyltransferase family 4 protein [Methanofollis fontis]|uniref:Glycosyltransferase family 1 protein n=1 Tax=Methanofollis fontis TaxID=2052832 RepID=A0A483CW22_9EURY|nr:glycosyltransferase family 4 protein [Methanofollis fontis]TAJ45747.1 glycosyltransferase family 1 protein [Methanofollis fontis]
MRIACFLDEYPPFFRGGLGTYAAEITPRLAAAGHALSIYASREGGGETEEAEDGIVVCRPAVPDPSPLLPLMLPVEVTAWPADSQHYFASNYLRNIVAAGDLLTRGEGADLSVSHDWLSAPAGMLVSASLRIPFVMHFHSTEAGRSPHPSPIIRTLENRAAVQAAVVVTVSRAMRDELITLGVQAEKIRVVYNGVDAERYSRERIPEERVRDLRRRLGIGDDPMILFIGRLTRVKGVDTLLRAFPYILQEVPDARLVIVGAGEMEGEVRHLAQMKGDGRVVLTPSIISEEERILHYAAADVCVFPSTYEPFGIVATEAMAMGCPVVVGAQGTSGMREQVVPEGPAICGFHINPFDPHDIAIYTSLILIDGALKRTMGRNGRNRVISYFTWDHSVQATLAAYREACRRCER